MQKLTPRLLLITGTLSIAVVSYYLFMNYLWFKEQVFSDSILCVDHPNYVSLSLHMHLSFVKNSLGIFTGFILIFIGFGFSFYSIEKTSDIKLKGAGISFSIISNSPGIIAIVIGAFVLTTSITTQANFPGALDYIDCPDLKSISPNKSNGESIIKDGPRYKKDTTNTSNSN
ncbi:MAG: hypothetical protein ACMVP2_03740 [Imperialibacter sp.]|uniref:hypothetical protein n=1 Tax=Imperialibacter sp. TaxID=2038411 RepID=UPI003A8B3B2E